MELRDGWNPAGSASITAAISPPPQPPPLLPHHPWQVPQSPGAQARGGVRRDPAHPPSLPTWQHSQWEPWWQPGKKNTRPPQIHSQQGVEPALGVLGGQGVSLSSSAAPSSSRSLGPPGCVLKTPRLGFKTFVTGSSEARLAGTPKSHQGSENRHPGGGKRAPGLERCVWSAVGTDSFRQWPEQGQGTEM